MSIVMYNFLFVLKVIYWLIKYFVDLDVSEAKTKDGTDVIALKPHAWAQKNNNN